MAELFGRDIHEEVVFVRIDPPASKCLHEVLHGSFEFTVAAAELLEEQVRETRIRTGNASIELQIFDVAEHFITPGWVREVRSAPQTVCRGRAAGRRMEAESAARTNLSE